MTNRQKVLTINKACASGHVYMWAFDGLNHRRVLHAADSHGSIKIELPHKGHEYLGLRVPFTVKHQTQHRLWS
jgi:hypothetical protein